MVKLKDSEQLSDSGPNICFNMEKSCISRTPLFESLSTCRCAVLCVGGGSDSVAQLFCQRNGFAVMDGISGTVQVSACC